MSGESDAESKSKSPKAVAEEWLDRFWNQGDLTVIDELAAEGAEMQVTRDIFVSSPEEIAAFHEQMMAGFEYVRIEPVGIVENGEEVAGFCHVHSKKRGSDIELEYDFGFYGTVRNGQWTKVYNAVDFLEMLKQLGMVERDIVERAMV